MENHPDIERLLNNKEDADIAAHIDECAVCSQIAMDAELLSLTIGDLRKPFEVSDLREKEIKEGIAAQATEIRKTLFKTNTFVKTTAAAAVLLIASGFWFFKMDRSLEPHNDVAKTLTKSLAQDFNGDGQVNVIDSYLLAQSLKRGDTLEDRFDLNKDGQVSEADLALLRKNVVSVGGQK